MAVFQISKIQIRRGQEGTGTGVPQLSSGEFGWAIDTQNLYIGNGSISEGAPFEGNTKILTENDSLIDNILLYQYKKNDTSISTGALPVARPLQDRLDDHVSAKSFGGNLQLAINELFLPESSGSVVSEEKRVILEIPAGIFRISSTLKIPAYATLIGAGSGKTFIIQESPVPIFETVPADIIASPSLTNQNKPVNLDIRGITLVAETANTTLGILNSASNSYFFDIEFQGVWNPLYLSGTNFVDNSSIGLKFNAESTLLSCQYNYFKNCKFVNLNTAIADDSDSMYNIFDNLTIQHCYKGVVYGQNTNGTTPGMLYGPKYNTIKNSKFNDVYSTGIKIKTGQYNISNSNTFIKVGTDGSPSNVSKFAPIEFIDRNNLSINDSFDRVQLGSVAGLPYISEVSGFAKYDTKFTNTINIAGGPQNSVENVLRLSSVNNAFHQIHYMYISSSQSFIKQGLLKIAINAQGITDMSGDPMLSVVDEYTCQGNDNTEFFAIAEDLDADTIKETITLKIKNKNENDAGLFVYWYETISTPTITSLPTG